MAIYMKLGSASGDVTEAGHTGWIELSEAQWRMSRTIRNAVGIGNNRESTSAEVGEMEVSKLIDGSSYDLTQQAFVGEALACQINFTRVSKGTEAVFHSIKLTDAIISSLVNSGQGRDRPTETMTLNFTVIAITDTIENASGAGSKTYTTTYDLTKAQTT